MEVMAVAAQGKVCHTIKTIHFEELNTYIDRLLEKVTSSVEPF